MKLGNHDANGSGGGGVGAIGLLQIEGAAGVVIGLAPGINRDGAVGRFGNGRPNWGINFLIAAFDRLIINALVVIVRHPADLQGEATERQYRTAAAESEVTPEVPPMNIHVYVAMHHNVVSELDGMPRLTAHLDRALNDMSLDMPDAAMAEAVDQGGLAS